LYPSLHSLDLTNNSFYTSQRNLLPYSIDASKSRFAAKYYNQIVRSVTTYDTDYCYSLKRQIMPKEWQIVQEEEKLGV
jgi:hypothetical protein